MPHAGRPHAGQPRTGGPGTGLPNGGTRLGRPQPGGRSYGYARPRPQVQPGRREARQEQPPIPAGQLIRQRDTALPESSTGSQPIAAIAPDGLESFARDLRALRAQAQLDYPEMAERSHFTMKTLASAAGGLRLPTLPVTVAYIQACGGDVADWEERWHKLAERLGAQPAPPEEEPPAPLAPPPEESKSDEVYVITSARPRQPGQ